MTSYVQDDVTKPSYQLLMQTENDQMLFRRYAPGGSGFDILLGMHPDKIENHTGAYRMYDSSSEEFFSVLDSNSRVGFRYFNPLSSWVSGLALGTGGNPNYLANWDPFKAAQDNVANPSWNILQSVSEDYTSIDRLAPGGSV